MFYFLMARERKADRFRQLERLRRCHYFVVLVNLAWRQLFLVGSKWVLVICHDWPEFCFNLMLLLLNNLPSLWLLLSATEQQTVCHKQCNNILSMEVQVILVKLKDFATHA